MRRSKKTSKLHVTGLCEENSPVTGEFPTVTLKMFPFHDVIMRNIITNNSRRTWLERWVCHSKQSHSVKHELCLHLIKRRGIMFFETEKTKARIEFWSITSYLDSWNNSLLYFNKRREDFIMFAILLDINLTYIFRDESINQAGTIVTDTYICPKYISYDFHKSWF